MTNKWIIENFNLKDHLPEIEITVESFPDSGDDENIVFKKKRLSEELSLFLYDSGQAVIEYLGDTSGDTSFMWDEEAAEMFNNIEYVRALELFELIYRKRVGGLSMDEIIRLGEEMRAEKGIV